MPGNLFSLLIELEDNRILPFLPRTGKQVEAIYKSIVGTIPSRIQRKENMKRRKKEGKSRSDNETSRWTCSWPPHTRVQVTHKKSNKWTRKISKLIREISKLMKNSKVDTRRKCQQNSAEN